MFDINNEIQKVQTLSKQEYLSQTTTKEGYSSSDFYTYMRWPLSWLKRRIEWIQIDGHGGFIAPGDKSLYPLLICIIEIKEKLGVGDNSNPDKSLELFYDYYSQRSNEQN